MASRKRRPFLRSKVRIEAARLGQRARMFDQLGKDALRGPSACGIERINDEQLRCSAGRCRQHVDQGVVEVKFGL